MSISSLCSQDLITLQNDSTLQYAAHLMKEHQVGGIVVIDSLDSRKPIGILTDRDIVLNVIADNRSVSTRVRQVMSKNVICVTADEGIEDVIEKMEENAVRRVVVIDDQERAIGLVSLDDLLQLLAKEIKSLGTLVQKQVDQEKRKLNAREILMT